MLTQKKIDIKAHSPHFRRSPICEAELGITPEHNKVDCLKWGRTVNLREAQGMLYSSPSDSEHRARSSQSTRSLPL